MPDILVVSDEATVREEVKAAIAEPGTTFRELTRGHEVLPAVREKLPDLAVLDLQIGKMGGMATCMELRLEEGADRLDHVPVLMLLDRRADVFLARRSDAEGWIVKPLDPLRLARAFRQVLAGGTYEDDAYRPPTVVPPSGSDALVQ
ncbi:MAG TPA: response regulator [Acidimicrobiales bacterium]|nr:response regulator [Acidimicrobiales bacterium]